MSEKMSKAQIYDHVTAVIADITGEAQEKITPETSIIDDLTLDSLALYEIVIELENDYQLKISDEEIESLKTIEEIVMFIEAHKH